MSEKALRGTFQLFLEYHCDDHGLLVRNFESLTPFFRFAEHGRYGRSVTPDGHAIRDAIITATGLPIRRVVGIPVESGRFARNFTVDQDLSLASVLRARHFSRMVAGPPNGKSVFSGLGWRTEPLWKRITGELGSAVRDSLPEAWSARAWASIDMALLMYLGYTLSGYGAAADELRPLVELLPAAIPLRRHRDREDTWFALLF